MAAHDCEAQLRFGQLVVMKALEAEESQTFSLYRQITEGRYGEVLPDGSTYSWCGDFPTWLYARAGCTQPEALNRKEIAGRWVPGDNIARLVRYSSALSLYKRDLRNASLGSAVVTEREKGNHVAVLIAHSPEGAVLLNGNGWMGKIARSVLQYGSSKLLGYCDTAAFASGQSIVSPLSGSPPYEGAGYGSVMKDVQATSQLVFSERSDYMAAEMIKNYVAEKMYEAVSYAPVTFTLLRMHAKGVSGSDLSDSFFGYDNKGLFIPNRQERLV